MGSSTRHLVNGIDAVIDSAHVVTDADIWVDVEELPEALRQARKLSDERYFSVYPLSEERNSPDGSVCIRLD